MEGKKKLCLSCQFAYGGESHDEKICSCFAIEEKELMKINFAFSHRASYQLLQNCDLPPPIKVFAGEKEAVAKSATVLQLWPPTNRTRVEAQDQPEDKLGLLKALHLSQTRAREAEKKASALCAEKDHLAALFWRESSQLVAYKQWLKLLELEISKMRSQLVLPQKEKQGDETRDEDGQGWALALFLVASFGLALSCRYFFL